jgi:hypothetical protein
MTEIFEKPADNLVKPVDNSIKVAEFRVSKFFLFLARLNFFRPIFFIFIDFFEFLKIRQIH